MKRLLLPALLAVAGCSGGEGTGEITSDRLYIEDCWDGPFNLGPDFFGANPFRDEALIIRIQRGDDLPELSDGLYVVVNGLQEKRAQLKSEGSLDLNVGLPADIEVVGADYDASSFSPTDVSLALYLHNTCHTVNGAVYSLSGSIHFDSLFSGDPSEEDAADRLTEASFTAQFADPRQLKGDAAENAAVTSTVSGNFSFYFQRGQPAQPFQ
ncbi:MAG TPA: hypothetical protein VM686_11745 [Polyangiaceae bacterium]|nr:hypothetical protein [Polyangiaceae bacterium]